MTTLIRRCFSVIACSALLGGCATAKLVPLPNGETGYAISDCDDMAECYKKAARVCGGKYEMLDRNNESVGVSTSNAYVGSGFIVPQYGMTVRCVDRVSAPLDRRNN